MLHNDRIGALMRKVDLLDGMLRTPEQRERLNELRRALIDCIYAHDLDANIDTRKDPNWWRKHYE